MQTAYKGLIRELTVRVRALEVAVGSTGGLTIAQLGVCNGGKGRVFVGGSRHCK